MHILTGGLTMKHVQAFGRHMFLASAFILGIIGCGEQQSGTAEQAGKKIDQVIEKGTNSVNEAMENTEEAINETAKDAGEAVTNTLESTGEALKDAGESVTEAVGLKD